MVHRTLTRPPMERVLALVTFLSIHAMTPENLIMPGNRCRTCRRAKDRRAYLRRICGE